MDKNPIFPFEEVAAHLAPNDDPALWREVLQFAVAEFAKAEPRRARTKKWAMQVGACSHWNRPHQTRWTAAGGFAYPDGYKKHFPTLDWSVLFIFEEGKWLPVKKLPGKGLRLFCVAVPSRTDRHNQAAIHARWSTGAKSALFGFRRLDGVWRLVAFADYSPRSRVIRGLSR